MGAQLTPVNQKATALLTVTFTDETGAIPGSVTDIKATLYDVATGGFINNRNNQTVFNTNGGAYNAGTGVLTLTMAPADNPIVGTPGAENYEVHRLLIVAYYGGTKQDPLEYDIPVKSLANMP